MVKRDPMIYRVEEEQSHQYYKMPKELFTNEKYKHMSANERLLYTALLDRKQLSRKHGWLDENGQVFLIYTREKVAELLNVSVRTAGKVFKQLGELNLILEERQGLNKPNKIYVKRLDYSVNDKGHEQVACQSANKLLPSYTESSKTEIINNSEHKFSQYYSINNVNDIKKFTDVDKTNMIITVYANTYKMYKKKNHPNLKQVQLSDVVDTIENIDSSYSLSGIDWSNLIDRYFTESPSDCNINHFTHGNELAGTIRGMLD